MGYIVDQNDPVVAEIIKRMAHLEIGTDPESTSHCLGHYVQKNDDGTSQNIQLHVIHAVDVIITDGKKVVVIERKEEPTLGKPCFPGGMLDPKRHGVETAQEAAIREAQEEVSVELKTEGIPVGKRLMIRPGDVRTAFNSSLEKNYGVRQGDIFMVSTQPMLFHVDNVDALKLKGRSDAKIAKTMDIKDLREGGHDSMGPDQYEFLIEAFGNRKRISKRLWNEKLDDQPTIAL